MTNAERVILAVVMISFFLIFSLVARERKDQDAARHRRIEGFEKAEQTEGAPVKQGFTGQGGE